MSVQIPSYPASSLSSVLARVETVVGDAVQRIGNSAKRGGYFCLVEWGPDCSATICSVRIGAPSNGTALRYEQFAREKAWRLVANHGHMSSWQTRDEMAEKYGGAIRAGKYILSFSGLPEIEDERAMLSVAVRLGLIPELQAAAIARTSSNIGFLEELTAAHA